MILYAVKGNKPTTGTFSDVLTSRLTEERYGHGAQKPVELYVDLLHRSCQAGDKVLDPFCGTGTIFPAAHSLKVFATGVEQSAEYYAIAAKRLQELDGER
jgi:site-specific DNA-methyltransferase (adenine-specific)